MTRSLRAALAAVGLALAMTAGESLAADGPGDQPPAGNGGGQEAGPAAVLQQIVVTATRRKENQQDVPVAVTALTSAFLEQNVVLHLSDLNGKVPALNVENYNSPAYTNLCVRAQCSANIAPGQDPAVGFYFNEFNFAYPIGIDQQMFDLQSVQVVKGPQGTLFGRNTTGGAVLVTAAAPTDRLEGLATLQATTFDGRMGYSGTGVLNLPAGDRLQFRLAVRSISRDGYVENLVSPQQLAAYDLAPFLPPTNGKPLDNDVSSAWRASVRWRPLDAVENLLTYMGSHLATRGVGYALTALDPDGYANFATGGGAEAAFLGRQSEQASDFWTTEQGAGSYDRLDTDSVIDTTSWQIAPELTLKNILGGRQFKLDQAIDFSGMPFQLLNAKLADHGHEWSEELQAQGQTSGGGLRWVAGVFYSGQHIFHPNQTLALPQFGAPVQSQASIADNKSHAVFGQLTYRLPFAKTISVTLGLRQTTDGREMSAFSYVGLPPVGCAMTDAGGATLPLDACFLHGYTSYRQVTHNVTIDYQPQEGTLLYVATRRGYRSGGWNYLPSSPQTFGPFLPEIVTDVEGGLKRDWHFGGSALRTNLAIYTQNYTDIQRFANPVGNPAEFSVINAASARINGGELEVTFVPVKNLELSGFYAYIHPKFNNFVTGSGNFTNNEMSQVSEHQYTVRGRYEWPVGGAGLLALQADYEWRSHFFYTDTAEGAGQGPPASQGQNAYGILNLRTEWNAVLGGPVDLAFFVENATATQYRPFGVMLYQSLGYNLATFGEPRTFGLEGTYHF